MKSKVLILQRTWRYHFLHKDLFISVSTS